MKFSLAILTFVGIQQIISAQINIPDEPIGIPPAVVPGNGSRSCPSQLLRQNARQSLLNNITSALGLEPAFPCGVGEWTRIAYLDMTNSSQRCPFPWREIFSNGQRVCGRPLGSFNMCHSVRYFPPFGRIYSRVCGRVIGYQIGHPDAFRSFSSIDQPYVEGVSITYGSPRTHIWTLAADLSETGNRACPCDNGSTASPPSFVGDNYYCESGNRNFSSTNNFLYADDPLWDGQECSSEGDCCSTAPWFNVNLIRPTFDSIEVRICADADTSEDTPIQLLELYVQ